MLVQNPEFLAMLCIKNNGITESRARFTGGKILTVWYRQRQGQSQTGQDRQHNADNYFVVCYYALTVKSFISGYR